MAGPDDAAQQTVTAQRTVNPGPRRGRRTGDPTGRLVLRRRLVVRTRDRRNHDWNQLKLETGTGTEKNVLGSKCALWFPLKYTNVL